MAQGMRVSSRYWLVGAAGLLSLFGVVGSVLRGVDLEFIAVGVVFYLVAALTVVRVPENRVSWTLFATAVGSAFTALHWLGGWAGRLLNFIGIFVLILPGLGVLLPLWFPTGSPPTRRWRWVEIVAWSGIAGITAAIALGAIGGEVNDDIEGCLSVSSCIELGGLLLIFVAMGAAMTALVVRWFRSEGIERQQMKPVVLAFSIFTVGTAIEFGVEQDHPVGQVLLLIGALLIPVSIGAAIVRYRLYDIDRIISRTLSYAVVVGLLGLMVAAVATIAGAQFDEPWVVAATTLGVAAMFNPVRRRVQGWVDRRFNRSRYDAQRVMDEFASSLRDRVDQVGIVEGWLEVVTETMQPSSMGVWVNASNAERSA
jgi:hypothetical protein